MIKRIGSLAAAGAFLALASATGPALATSQSASLTVNGSVTQSCTAFTPSTNTLTFPAYDSFTNATADDDAGPVSYNTQCTKGASGVKFAVNGGANYANSGGTTRAMKSSGGFYLNYALYSDSARSVAWAFDSSTGAGIGGSALTISSSGDTQTLTVYGRIPRGQDPNVGTDYTDSVTVSVNY